MTFCPSSMYDLNCSFASCAQLTSATVAWPSARPQGGLAEELAGHASATEDIDAASDGQPVISPSWHSTPGGSSDCLLESGHCLLPLLRVLCDGHPVVLGVRGMRSVATAGVPPSRSPVSIAASSNAKSGFRPVRLGFRVAARALGRGISEEPSSSSPNSSEMQRDDASPSPGIVLLVIGEIASCLHAATSFPAANRLATDGSAAKRAPPAVRAPSGSASLAVTDEGGTVEPKMQSQKAS
mmetsp:Transcript_126467/g.393621  ORF Transcript_126467/g.393621 Transcript_126467/m.393621 type:complete len:240 (-) Transcript_126467:307-1026(-)